MFTAKFHYMAKGFVSGAVVTASVCYSLLREVPARTTDRKESAHLFPYGTPVDHRRLMHYSGHSLYYDAERKQPLWVSELLTENNFSGKAHRKHSKFRKDDSIPDQFTSENSDYFRSGWSRGHMAPAGNYKHSQEAMDNTFLLTNIVPQNLNNNAGFWNRLELHCRDLAKEFDRVHIITGPLYQANQIGKGKKLVQYEVIGHNLVPVPTHLYKIVMAFKDAHSQPYLATFVVPNKPIEHDEMELTKYQVDLSELEKRTGFLFHPDLVRTNVKNLCQYDGGACRLKHWKQFEIYFATRRLESAKSAHDIENVVNELKEKGVTPTAELQKLLKLKLNELNAANSNAQPAGQVNKQCSQS